MTEARPSTYIIAILVFVLISVGGISLISIFNTDDSGFKNTGQFELFNKSFNKLDDVTSQVGKLEATLQSSQVSSSPLSDLISGAWQSLRLLGDSFGFMKSAFTSLSTFFGVPAWIVVLGILAITVMLVFSIWSAIFQYKL